MPKPPVGVFDMAEKHGQHIVSWQPQHDVRIAMVIISVNSSPVQFVAAGRSLRETENREYILRKMVFISWILCMAVLLFHAVLQFYFKK